MFATRAKMISSSSSGGAEFAVGSFTPQSTVGNQSITSVGFTPKALILWGSGSDSASGTWAAKVNQFIGFTTGPTESYAVAGASFDAQATSDTSRRIAEKATTMNAASNDLTTLESDLVSFDADGFTLDWTSPPSAFYDQQIMFLAIGGDGVSAKAVNWSSPTATGNKAVTGVGFEPSVVIHAAYGGSNLPPSSQTEMRVGFGVMDSSGNQWTNALAALDGAATADTSRYQRTDKCIASLQATGGSVQEEAEFVSMDADGFTVNFTTAFASALKYISLCLSGVTAKAASFNKDTSATIVTQSITGVGFQPSAYLLSNVGSVTNASPDGEAQWSLGATDDTNQRTTAQQDQDLLSTTDANSVWHSDKVATVPAPGSSTRGLATHSSMDADGFTLDWTQVQTLTAEEILYLALK